MLQRNSDFAAAAKTGAQPGTDSVAKPVENDAVTLPDHKAGRTNDGSPDVVFCGAADANAGDQSSASRHIHARGADRFAWHASCSLSCELNSDSQDLTQEKPTDGRPFA